MSLENIKKPAVKITFEGEEWNVRFTLRNFAALAENYGISENEILQGLIKGDIQKIPFAIWTSTLVFAPFDPQEPLKIEKQIPLEKLFELEMGELKNITDEVIKAMEAFLPKQPPQTGGDSKKPQKVAQTKAKKKKSSK